MFKVTGRRVELVFNLDNGIYLFDDQSATGKTRLCKLMMQYNAYGEKVASFSYNDKLRGNSLSSFLNSVNANAILIDRYDLYSEDAHSEIIETSKKSIVLIDCKGVFNVTNEYEMCWLQMEPSRIEVSL